jgi:integrase
MANIREDDDALVTGFDRGIDYKTMKDKLINCYREIVEGYSGLDPDGRVYKSKKNKLLRKEIYIIISIIQLRNGSRITEAVDAFKKFVEEGGDLNEKINVKIAKSKSTKYKKDTKEAFRTKTRYRKMIYPVKWIGSEISEIENIRNYLEDYKGDLNRRVLDYLLMNHNCNTHSLRYSCINYLLYDQKKEMALVAKFVGHSNVNQLVTYTQKKESDKLLDLDI